jgi:hypothetical protein
MGRKSQSRRARPGPRSEALPFFRRREVRYGIGITLIFALLTVILFLSNRSLWLAPEKIVTVYRVHGCRCAFQWERELEREGFSVVMNEVHSLKFIRQRLRTPPKARGCHVGEYLGYFLEGHVPAAALQYLSSSRPPAMGLLVNGDTPHPIDEGQLHAGEIVLLSADGHELSMPPNDLAPTPRRP